MGILGEMAKGLLEKALGGSSSQNPLMDIVMGLITNPQGGGLQGLIQTFKEKGLGDAMSSWISTGENQSVSGGQIQHALLYLPNYYQVVCRVLYYRMQERGGFEYAKATLQGSSVL